MTDRLNILILGDTSQELLKLLRNKGHNVFSTSGTDCTGGYPQCHIIAGFIPLVTFPGPYVFTTQDDTVYNIPYTWDLIIAIPGFPCFAALKSPCSHVAIICDNIVPDIPGAPDQILTSHRSMKIWLKGLPHLKVTDDEDYFDLNAAITNQWPEYVQDMNLIESI